MVKEYGFEAKFDNIEYKGYKVLAVNNLDRVVIFGHEKLKINMIFVSSFYWNGQRWVINLYSNKMM